MGCGHQGIRVVNYSRAYPAMKTSGNVLPRGKRSGALASPSLLLAVQPEKHCESCKLGGFTPLAIVEAKGHLY